MARKKKKTFTEQLQQLIEEHDEPCYHICLATGIEPASMSRFMHDKGGLSMRSLDALSDYLGWKVTAEKALRRKKRR